MKKIYKDFECFEDLKMFWNYKKIECDYGQCSGCGKDSKYRICTNSYPNLCFHCFIKVQKELAKDVEVDEEMEGGE